MSRNSKINSSAESSEKRVRLKKEDSSKKGKRQEDESQKYAECIKWLLHSDPQLLLKNLENAEEQEQFLIKVSELSDEIHKIKTERLLKDLSESKDVKLIQEVLAQQILLKSHKQTELSVKSKAETSQRIFLLFECGLNEEVQFTVECIERVQGLKVVNMTLEVNFNEFSLYKFDGSDAKFLNKKALEKCFKLMGLQTGLELGFLFGLLLRLFMLNLSPKFSFFADVFDEVACRDYANFVNHAIKLAVNKLEKVEENALATTKDYADFVFFAPEDLQEGEEEEWGSDCEDEEEEEEEQETNEGKDSDSL